jgi:hypothetical protein
MSRKFYAINRETGERWKPKKKDSPFGYKQYLVMYDSGYLAVVTHDFYVYIEPLDAKIWKVEYKNDN